jgi:sulfite reductase alpha subunit-like flavoprotein
MHIVEKFVVALGKPTSDLDLPVEDLPTEITLRQLLTWQINLTTIVPLTSLKVLQRWTKDAKMTLTSEHLEVLVNEYDTTVRNKGYDITTILDMIPQGPKFPVIPLAQLLKTLPPLSPRLYSYTHNPLTHRNTASLLCRLLRYRDSRVSSHRIVDGLCSSYLNERVKPGDEVAIFFRESNFHLPQDPVTPVIMIAGGTGIAPFLSFLEERSRLYNTGKKMGPAILYYGCRTSDEYMFMKELYACLREGNGAVLSRVVVAFSSSNLYESNNIPRELNEVIYPGTNHIPTVACNDKVALGKLVDQGAYIYVCGGAGNFGKAVRNTVNQICLSSSIGQSGMGDHDGVRHLVAQKRYFEDLAD